MEPLLWHHLVEDGGILPIGRRMHAHVATLAEWVFLSCQSLFFYLEFVFVLLQLRQHLHRWHILQQFLNHDNLGLVHAPLGNRIRLLKKLHLLQLRSL